jgi:hypothetical protein
MNRFHNTGRLAVIAAGLTSALLALCAGAAPAALAEVMVPSGGDPHGRPGLPGHAHALATGGTPGWPIALILAAAALAAAAAVIGYRTRAARRRVTVSAA